MSDVPPQVWIVLGLAAAGLIAAAVWWGKQIHRDMQEVLDAVDELDETWNVAARRIGRRLDEDEQP